MKTKMTKMAMLCFSALILFSVSACKKNNDPNALTGDTSIPLTAKDSVTTMYFQLNGQSFPQGATIKVAGNDNGMVTYTGSFNLNAYPDTLINNLVTILPSLINYYNPKDLTYSISPSGILTVQFTLKITSDGMQNYFVDGNPWTMRYDDALGTNNNVTRKNGQVLTATVTEKTGQDDWPFGFYYIKTSKIEYNAPADDPAVQKVTLRVNHKFGLVYVKADTKTGKALEVFLYPYFLM
jgi:hypothetical protein